MAMKPYTVTFIADHFTMNVAVELDLLEPDIADADDDELETVATDLAKNMMLYHYGIDISKLCDTVETIQG
jgi:hypothetical protein